jgi:hypothetical protein
VELQDGCSKGTVNEGPHQRWSLKRRGIPKDSLQSSHNIERPYHLNMVKFSHGCWHPAQDTIIDWAVEVVKSEAREDSLYLVTVSSNFYVFKEYCY